MADRFRSYNGVASELSEPEEALHGRIGSSFEQPAFDGSGPIEAVSAYRIMRDDLESRSKYNAVLSQEQELAYRASAREELARQAARNDRDADEAKSAMTAVGAAVKGGKSPREALSEAVGSNPLLAFNPAFNKASKDFGDLALDPETEAIEQSRRDLEVLKMEGEKTDLQTKFQALGYDTPEGKLAAVRRIRQTLDAQDLLASNNKRKQELEALELTAREEMIAKNPMMLHQAVMGDAYDGGMAEAKLGYAFEQAGLGEVENPSAVVGRVSPVVKRMLSDADFLGRLNEKGSLPALLSHLNNVGNLPVADPEHTRSLRALTSMAGGHAHEMEKLEIFRKNEQKEKDRAIKLSQFREKKLGSTGTSVNNLMEDLSRMSLAATKQEEGSEGEKAPLDQVKLQQSVEAMGARADAFAKQLAAQYGLEVPGPVFSASSGSLPWSDPAKGGIGFDPSQALQRIEAHIGKILEAAADSGQPAPQPAAGAPTGNPQNDAYIPPATKVGF